MKSLQLLVLAPFLLAACDGNPFGNAPDVPPDTGGGGGTVPAEVARDMTAVSYVNGVLKINMQGISSSGEFATFTRAASLDITNAAGGPDYQAYVYQETDLTRSYLAYVATNERGNLLAVSSSDGGQFNQNNGGGQYVRLTEYTKPTLGTGPEQGLFSYAGTYAGIFVPGDFADGSDPRPPSLRPVEPWVTEGVVQINGDFQHSMVEGGITNRKIYDQDGNRVRSIEVPSTDGITPPTVIDVTFLPDLALRETAIDENGEFLGSVEFSGTPGEVVGDYAGAFGGLQASDVAGVLWLNPITGQTGISEYGVFNLPRCDLAGASPLCIPR